MYPFVKKLILSSVVLYVINGNFRIVRRFRRGREIFGAVSQWDRHVGLLKDRLVCDCETHRPRSEKRRWNGRGYPEVGAAQRDVLTDRDRPRSTAIHSPHLILRTPFCGTFAILSASTLNYLRVQTDAPEVTDSLLASTNSQFFPPVFFRTEEIAPIGRISRHSRRRSRDLTRRLPRFGKKRSADREQPISDDR